MAQRLAADPEGSSAWGTGHDGLLRHRDDVHAVVRRVLADAGMAEDVVQETLVRALRHEATVERDRAGAWLTVVGRRLAVDVSRAHRRVDVVADCDDRPVLGDDPAELAERRQLLAQLAAAMDELSPRQRRLLLRQVDAGLTLAQLAAEEQTTVASVRSVLARAREALRANLHHSGWLVAGLIPRLLAAARSPADRLLARIERTVPLLPQARHDIADTLTAAAAAVALLLAPSTSFPGRLGPSSDQESAALAAAVPADPLAPGTDTTEGESIGSTGEPALLPSLSGPSLPAVPNPTPDDPDIVIPFDDLGGDVTQFAVSPDQQTVFATGGWRETEGSAGGQSWTRTWEPVLYRSDDGGRHWQPARAAGFLPGRILFAPRYPADPRIFVVNGCEVSVSQDGGRTFGKVEQAGPPDLTNPAASLPSESPDPKHTVREEQGRPATPQPAPAVLSPGFSDGDERIFVGGERPGVFDARLGVCEPVVSAPPWWQSNGIAPAPDYAQSRAVLVGAVVHTEVASRSRGAVFRCQERQCKQVHAFDDMGTAPGLFVSPKDPNLVYAWTTYTAHRSVDGGRTWAKQQLGPVVELVEVGERLVFLSMSGVPMSDDRGATWRQLRVVYSVSAVAPVGERGLLLAAGPGIACSPDAGDHWHASCLVP